jgi:O-antigen/teichoic acid export membrane protein
VNFGSKIVSAFTGLTFTVMVARWLIPAQLGLWEFVITIVTIASYPIGVVAFWVTRDIARGKLVGRTALVAGVSMSGGGILLYFALTFLTYSRVSSSLLPFLLGGILLPLSYWNQVSNSIVQGYRPVAMGYALIAAELSKLAMAYPALYIFKAGISGVMLALIVSYFFQSMVSTYLVRGALADQLKMTQARQWFGSAAWLPAVSFLPGIVGISDTAVASLGFGTTIVGYYQAAFLVASVVGYSAALTYSLYPLLLGGGSEKLPAITVEFSLLFSIPMAVGVAVLAQPILFMLGTKYMASSVGLEILALMFVFLTVSGIIDQTLMGTEKVDLEEKAKFSSYATSNLLFVPVVNLLSSMLYVGAMFAALSFATAGKLSTSETVALWTICELLATLVTLGIKGVRVRGIARIVPGIVVVKYAAASAVMGAAVYLASLSVLNRGLGTLFYGIQLLGMVALGAAIYFGVLYAIDGRFRNSAKTLWAVVTE